MLAKEAGMLASLHKCTHACARAHTHTHAPCNPGLSYTLPVTTSSHFSPVLPHSHHIPASLTMPPRTPPNTLITFIRLCSQTHTHPSVSPTHRKHIFLIQSPHTTVILNKPTTNTYSLFRHHIPQTIVLNTHSLEIFSCYPLFLLYISPTPFYSLTLFSHTPTSPSYTT